MDIKKINPNDLKVPKFVVFSSSSLIIVTNVYRYIIKKNTLSVALSLALMLSFSSRNQNNTLTALKKIL
jgi:hypothetical protein